MKDTDTGLLVICYASCQDVRAELRARGLLKDERWPALHHGTRHSIAEPARAYVPKRDNEPNPDPCALRSWLSALPIAGTLAEIYLRQYRGIGIPLPPSLRFARSSKGMPMLVAAVSGPDRKIIAVQTTFLAECGAKASLAMPRITKGKLGTGVVRLAPACDVLGIAEGIETALSAMELSRVPTWAVLGAQRLPTVSIPSSVRELHIFADNDEVGRAAAERAAARHAAEGRRVLKRFPPDRYGDYAEILQVRVGRNERF